MTIIIRGAADPLDGEGRGQAPMLHPARCGVRDHSAAYHDPKCGAATALRKLAGYQPLRMRVGDSDLRLSLSGPANRFPPANQSAARLPCRGVIAGLSSLAGVAGSLRPLRRGSRLQFVPIVKAIGSLLSIGNTRVKFRQEPLRCLANPFHFNLSAPRGLAAVVYGQDDDRRKQGNVRQSGGEIRNVEC